MTSCGTDRIGALPCVMEAFYPKLHGGGNQRAVTQKLFEKGLGRNGGSDGALGGRKMRRFGGSEKWRETQGAYDGVAKHKKFSIVLSKFSKKVQQTATHCGYCPSQSTVTWYDLRPDQITLVEGHRNQPHIHIWADICQLNHITALLFVQLGC